MRTGRPREFDADKALDRAMRLFWKKGYEGTSLTDLTRAMGISRPSLYAAFGDKEQLFRKALDRYGAENGRVSNIINALNQPTAKKVAEQLLRSTVDGLTCPKNPHGCFLVQSALACGESAQAVRIELIARQKQSQAAVRKRFARAVAEGDLPAKTDTADLARFIATVTAGLSVQASGGASRDELLAVVEMALRAWPE
jgi:AcrR family transcriptional regulator